MDKNLHDGGPSDHRNTRRRRKTALSYAILTLLLLMSAFFSGTETACFSLDQLQKKRLAETVGGKKALRILVDPGILMASILLGNTFVNVAASTVAASIVRRILPGALGMGVGVISMTFLLLVVGEISPKTIARKANVRWFLAVAPIMGIITRYLSIPARLLRIPAVAIDRIIPGGSAAGSFAEAEVNTLMGMAMSEGFLGYEADMALAILELEEKPCVSAMVSRGSVAYITSDMPFSNVRSIVEETSHAHYPVLDTETGTVAGLADAREILGRGSLTIEKIPYFPESAGLHTVFSGLRSSGVSIGAVIDEYGDWSGIITIDDILEKAVFSGVPGSPLPEGVHLSGDGYTVPADIPLELLASILGLDRIESEYAESCGGLLQELTGMLPATGQTVVHQGLRFRVLETRGKAMKKILTERIPKE